MLAKIQRYFGKTRPERFFLVTASCFGLLFVLLVPPFNNPDEPVHFFRVYQLSSMHLFSEKTSKGIATTIPSSYIRSVQDNLSTNGKQINFHPDVKASPSRIIKTLGYDLHDSKKEVTYYSTAASYAPTSYLPQVIVMSIDRLLHLSPVAMLYSVRLAGLAFYVAIIYSALKILPYRKWAVVFVALLPMSLAQSAAVTADSALIASMILLFSIILYAAHNKKVELSDKAKVGLAASVLIVGMSKQVFILITPVLFLVSATAFGSKQARRLYIYGTLLITWLFAALWGLLNPALHASVSSAAAVDAHNRLITTLHYPVHLAVVLGNTFFSPKSNDLYTSFAGNFGWLDTPIPLWTSALVIGVLAYCLITEYDRLPRNKNKFYNPLLLAICAALFVAICSAFYLYWTPIESRQILGLQGRYFIPLVLLLALLQGKKFLVSSQNDYARIVLLTVPIVLTASIFSIIGRFYG